MAVYKKFPRAEMLVHLRRTPGLWCPAWMSWSLRDIVAQKKWAAVTYSVKVCSNSLCLPVPPKWILIHSDTEYKDPASAETQIVLDVLILTGPIIYITTLNCEFCCLFIYLCLFYFFNTALDVGCRWDRGVSRWYAPFPLLRWGINLRRLDRGKLMIICSDDIIGLHAVLRC